jgi:hypothetical protein
MRTATKELQLWGTLTEAPSLLCFAVAMLSAGAIVSDRWQADQLWLTLPLLGVSALLSCLTMRYILVKSAAASLADVDVAMVRADAFSEILKADRLVVEGVDLLRKHALAVAERQPMCDTRLRPLLQAMAMHGRHKLCALACDAMDRAQIVADPLSDVVIGDGGGVSAVWRGHQVMLYAPAANCGERQLRLCLCIDGEAAAHLLFDESLRPEAAPLLARLRRHGVESVVHDAAPTDLLICAGRQLQVPIRSMEGAGDWGNALIELGELGHYVLRLTSADNRDVLLLKNAVGEVLMEMHTGIGSVWSAVQAAANVQAAQSHGALAVMAVHILALAAFFAGGQAWVMAGAAILLTLGCAMPLRVMLKNKCRLLEANYQEHVKKYAAL